MLHLTPCTTALPQQSQQPPEANAHSAERAAATFRAYDVEGRNHLDRPQMMAALAEMGAVHGMSGKAIGELRQRRSTYPL